jgi:hypothetical protein
MSAKPTHFHDYGTITATVPLHDTPFRAAWRHLRRTWPAGRGKRVVAMLAAVWLIGLGDLAFTILAFQTGWFFEANPIAEAYLHSPTLLALFKFALMIPATGILLIFRRQRVTELACGGLCAVYAALVVTWINYYTLYLV